MKQIWSNMGRWIAGKGFYIVLFLCIAAIGISGYFLFATFRSSVEVISPTLEEEPQVSAQADPEPEALPSEDSVSTMGRTDQAEAEQTQSADQDGGSQQEDAQEQAGVDLETVEFLWPVSGEVVGAFSVEALAYNATMGDWRVHSGIDIAAELGTQVVAVAAGTVDRVVQDDMMGTTVVIDHGGGLTSTYCNLEKEPAVVVGDQVQAGDLLGTVGETALAESALSPHLHLEMALNGTAVDPLSYLEG
ncbi:MAG: M23 family metallopeptidase [Oscillospiraceae bacterium]|nr:M23 family metallopeptidase [Oscillospiraceae bacterium]